MISGDPYALCQSMFGMEITGLLHKGELYHKYWIDKGSTELACFRAPMTCHNNIRKMKLADREETRHWYQYITTAAIFNAWDTACDAMNGADKDGDTNMDTDNEIIVRNTLNSPTIMCVQRKAEKRIPSEEDIIQSNKLAFNDDIGTVTNYVTSMIERQAGFKKGTLEYEELAYRIMCGQLYQQNTIDRAKGIIAKPMPDYWYNLHRCVVKENDDAETVKAKKIETKTEPKENNKEKNKNNADTDSEILPVNELKPRVMEKKPVINSGANFETKKTEIMNELNLTEKQRISAEKIYNKNRDEIAAINIEMENAQKELMTIKKADLDTKTKERHISTIQTKLGDMYQTRDSVHNAAMKKFDNILDDEQKEIWLNLKIKGARLFPDIEGIK